MAELASVDPQREPLVRIDEVKAYLGVSDQWVYKRSRDAVDPLPVYQVGLRGFRRYRMSEISAWLERRKNA